MTLQECYEAMGGDYGSVLARLRSERLIDKFVLKFLDDKSYELFVSSMASGSYEEAFRAVHTIKGVCQNLGFDRLSESSAEMADALRHGYTPKADELVGRLDEDYKLTADAIKRYKDYKDSNGGI